MANHGWLPRSGKNIDLAAVRFAVAGAFNYAPTAFDDPFAQAVAFNLTTTGNSSTFHLADLAKHDAIEFDGSLSRNDIYFGDNLHYDPAIFATVAKNLGLHDDGHGKDKYVTVEVAAKARAARVKEAMRVNPTFNASVNEMSGSPGTTALYLVTLFDDEADAAPKAWVRAFFGKFGRYSMCFPPRGRGRGRGWRGLGHCDTPILTDRRQRKNESRTVRDTNSPPSRKPPTRSLQCFKGLLPSRFKRNDLFPRL